MGTSDWRAARQMREPVSKWHEGAPNLFQGGTTLETAKLATVPVVRLNVWPAGASCPPYSYAVDAASGEEEIRDDKEPDSSDFDGFEDQWQREERRRPVDFSSEFGEVESEQIQWRETPEATLPFSMEWQQSSESSWELFFSLSREAFCMGLGERQSGLNLRSAVHTLFNTDDPHHTESIDSMYKAIPFLIILHQGQYHGLFLDSPARQRWDLDADLTGTARVQLLSRRGWQLYCFGPAKLADLLAAYTKLTGRSKLPPLWSLGHQQSRWSYPDQDTVVRIAYEFRSRKIPCDAIVLDIDYLDDYRVFTYSTERFPDFPALLSDLAANNFKVITIVDPGVKKDSKYFVFNDGKKHDYFCTRSDGKLFIGDVWAGQSAFPDFLRDDVRMWWAALHGFYLENGVAGIWNDMNEPALFRSQRPLDTDATELPPDNKQLFMQQTAEGRVGHFEVRNLYGFQMSRATYDGLMAMRPNQRPFVLTRAGYAGVQRYAAVWLGDNMSWWGHLARSIPMLLNVGLSGVPFCGVDIGGFGHNCSAELLVRWYELGIFYPLFRNHCALHGASQEPWAFTPEIEDHCRKLIETRYRLLPYIQRLFLEHTRTGAPLMRPLAWQYGDDEFAVQVEDQFLFGDDIMVAPILSQNRTMRAVYMPKGIWHSFDGSRKYEGGRMHQIELALGSVPAFVRDGAVLPLSDPVQHTGELDNAAVTFHCYGDSGSGAYIEDDGISFEYENGVFNEWRIRIDQGRFIPQPINLGLPTLPAREYRMRYGGTLSAVALS